MIAFCRLDCHECGAFWATKENDDPKRAEVAQEWSRLFKVEVKSEDINCEGCQCIEGLVFNYCKVCEIRKCGKEKGDLISLSATSHRHRRVLYPNHNQIHGGYGYMSEYEIEQPH